MKQVAGWWLPESESHFGPQLAQSEHAKNRGTYQMDTLIAALNIRGRERLNRAVDVGAHVGLWTYFMCQAFKTVEAFEPLPELRKCFERNMRSWTNWNLHPEALGRISNAEVALCIDRSNTGHTHVRQQDDELGDHEFHAAKLIRLDDFHMGDVDFIKIDAEGYETHVIEGAKETLMQHKPVMVVEQKGGHKQYGIEGEYPAVAMLAGMGALVKNRVRDDFILAWDET